MNPINICTFCLQECDVDLIEESEPYEFWGERGTYRHVVRASSCCSDAVDTYMPLLCTGCKGEFFLWQLDKETGACAACFEKEEEDGHIFDAENDPRETAHA